MTEKSFPQTRIPLGKDELAKIRTKAIRRGIWFRVLTKAERAQMELTMKIVKKIRSFVLAKVLTTIIKKLIDAMESKVVSMMKTVGLSLAQKSSRIAQNWGNKLALHWAADPSFAQYLTVNYINTPASFRV